MTKASIFQKREFMVFLGALALILFLWPWLADLGLVSTFVFLFGAWAITVGALLLASKKIRKDGGA